MMNVVSAALADVNKSLICWQTRVSAFVTTRWGRTGGYSFRVHFVHLIHFGGTLMGLIV